MQETKSILQATFCKFCSLFNHLILIYNLSVKLICPSKHGTDKYQHQEYWFEVKWGSEVALSIWNKTNMVKANILAMVMIGWCDDGSTGRSEVGVGGPTLVSSSPPPPPATTLQPCPAMWSAEIRGNQWIKAKSVSLNNTLRYPEMGKRWSCIIMLLKPPVASSWTEVGYQDDLLLSNGYNLPPAGQLMFVNASLSHPAGYPWSSRSPNDLREGTSCPEWVPQMRSVIFDPAFWPPTYGGRGQEWSDAPLHLPLLDLDLQPSVIGEGWSRIPTPLHPALPTLPPPTQRPSLMEESLLRWVHRWFINSFFFKLSLFVKI